MGAKGARGGAAGSGGHGAEAAQRGGGPVRGAAEGKALTTFAASLPRLYHAWLPEALLAADASERRATCGSCAMCNSAPRPFVEAFSEATKCCTYWPKLPNYLVGALLADRSEELAEGRQQALALIKSGLGVTPLGLGPSSAYRALLDARRPLGFGRDESLLCPYYRAGSCSIWPYRETDCTTYFCRYGGAFRYELWRRVSSLLIVLERKLSSHSARMLAGCLSYDADPAAFFGACLVWVSGLSLEEVRTVVGAEFDDKLAAVQAALTEPKPSSGSGLVTLAQGIVVRRAQGRAAVSGYNELDPVVLSEAAMAELEAIEQEGTPVQALKERLAAVGEGELAARLVDHELLVPVIAQDGPLDTADRIG